MPLIKESAIKDHIFKVRLPFEPRMWACECIPLLVYTSDRVYMHKRSYIRATQTWMCFVICQHKCTNIMCTSIWHVHSCMCTNGSWGCDSFENWAPNNMVITAIRGLLMVWTGSVGFIMKKVVFQQVSFPPQYSWGFKGALATITERKNDVQTNRPLT